MEKALVEKSIKTVRSGALTFGWVVALYPIGLLIITLNSTEDLGGARLSLLLSAIPGVCMIFLGRRLPLQVTSGSKKALDALWIACLIILAIGLVLAGLRALAGLHASVTGGMVGDMAFLALLFFLTEVSSARKKLRRYTAEVVVAQGVRPNSSQSTTDGAKK
jgi:hypothetical protein